MSERSRRRHQLKNPYRFLFDDLDWKELLLDHYGVQAKMALREAFVAKSLETTKLEQIVKSRRDGFEIVGIDKNLATQLNAKLLQESEQDHTFDQFYRTETSDFGFVVLKDSRIVSSAIPADLCDDLVEIQINTHPDFKRRGLALAVAARFLLSHVDKGYTVDWDAKNDISAGKSY